MQIDLNSLAGGAALERINRELGKIADNIMDPNTKAEAVRTLTMQIKIKPDEAREIGMSDIQVKSSLAPAKGIPAKFVFDYDKEGKAVMAELKTDRGQTMIDNDGDVADDTGEKLDAKVVNGKFR